MTNKPIKAITYARVSTDEQMMKGGSLKEQQHRLSHFCEIKNYELLEHFEESYSAKTFERPVFQSMLKAIKSRALRPEYLIVASHDRFSRNVFDSYDMVRRLNALGVKVLTLDGGELDYGNSSTFITTALSGMVAQHENIKKSENTKRGMRHANRQGRWTGTTPYGYKRNLLTRIIEPDKQSSALVAEAFREVAKGVHSCEEVRKHLSKKGCTLSPHAFLDMLRNVVYIGQIRIKAWKEQGEKEDEIVMGKHEPLIDIETFNVVQRRMRNKNERYKAKSTRSDLFPLRGFLICQRCGRPITASGSKSRAGAKYHYYHCQVKCGERFRADLANQRFIDLLASLKVNDETLSLYYLILKDVFNRDEEERKKSVNQLTQKLSVVESNSTLLTEKYVHGKIDDDDYKALKARYSREKNDLLELIEGASLTPDNYGAHLATSFSILRDMDKYYANATLEIKQLLIGSIFSKKLIFENGNYRTTGVNELIKLITLNTNGIEDNEKGLTNEFVNESFKAPPPGLEPGTY